MSETVLVALIAAGGTILGAGLTAVGAYILYRRKHKDSRRDAQEDKADNVIKALQYLMLYVIEERGKELIALGYATFEQRRRLRHWHDLYHKGLNGNGDADQLMDKVNALPYEPEETEGRGHDAGV